MCGGHSAAGHQRGGAAGTGVDRAGRAALPGPAHAPVTRFLFQRRNFTLAFQAAESVGIKSTLVSPRPLRRDPWEAW